MPLPKGWKHTEEAKMKISKALKGCVLKPQQKFKKGNTFGFKKGFTPWNKGKKGVQIAWNKGKKHPQIAGDKNPAWKGGKRITGSGYIVIYKPEHPYNKGNYIREHRFVVEQAIGRYLTSEEIVHHINEIKTDNRIENLMLFKNVMYHFWFHKKGFCNPKGIIFDGRNYKMEVTNERCIN